MRFWGEMRPRKHIGGNALVIALICVCMIAGVMAVEKPVLQAQGVAAFANPPCSEVVPANVLFHPYFKPQNPLDKQVFLNGAAIENMGSAAEIKKLLTQSEALNHKGHFKQARKNALAVLKKVPANAAALYIVGLTYYNEKDTAKALEYFKQAGKSDTTLANLHFYMGVIYHDTDKDDLEKPLKQYDLEIQYHPQNADAHINRGMIYGYMGDMEKAFADCAKAVELTGNDIENLLVAARFSEQLQVQVEQGKKLLARALELYPRSWRAWEIKAGFVYHDNDYKSAERDYLYSFSLYKRPTTLYELCWTYIQMGDIQRAKQIYDQAVRLKADDDSCYRKKAQERLIEHGVVFGGKE